MSETALVPVDVQPRDVMVRSQNIASAAKEIVMRCSVNLQGKRYICAEGWQALANLSGYSPRIDEVVELMRAHGAKTYAEMVRDGDIEEAP